MPRSIQDILDHADELAQRFENLDADGGLGPSELARRLQLPITGIGSDRKEPA